MRTLLFLLVLAASAAAQTVDSVQPGCAGPDDVILIRGSEFGETPTVTIGGVSVDVLRSDETRIVTRIPADAAAGEATVDVDGATGSVTVLARGAPVVGHLSSAKATQGQVLVVAGRHLLGATAVFVDGGGTDVASVDLRGGRYVGFFKVPGDLAAASYTLEVRNDAGDSGACSPDLEIVEKGAPTLDSAAPDAQQPGGRLACTGSDLGPLGFCRATWTDGDGNELMAGGFANGYDTVYTYVPIGATPGTSYDIVIDFADGSSTEESGVLAYAVGDVPPPTIRELEFTEGPAGTALAVFGSGFFAGFGRDPGKFNSLGALPTVAFTRDGAATEAKILFGGPGFGFGDDIIVVEVPDVADGDYDVTVTAGEIESNAVVFSVKDLPLAVASMTPTTQKANGRLSPVHITGTGFGTGTLDVTWDDENDASDAPRAGLVLFHYDREIFVVPPGGWRNPLAAGTYTVRVVKSPGTAEEESVVAGTYTVE
ncbi:MAG: IPT/TIG domain-containing protein [Planctomycetota bacterium]|jgi:hypothetical protein